MEKIDFKKQNIPFTQVANGVLNDARITAKAKGIYAYLYSKPDGWSFESKRISNDMKDSRDSIRSGIKELEEYGYLIRYKLPNGRMVYKITLPPMTENPAQDTDPMPEKATDGKSHSGKIRPISNKEVKVIKSINNNNEGADQSKPPLDSPDPLAETINSIISKFSLINPNFKLLYANKTQRRAVKTLLEMADMEKIVSRIYLAAFCFNDQFFPNFFTPYELQLKYAKVSKFLAGKAKDRRFFADFDNWRIELEKKNDAAKPKKTIEVKLGGRKISYQFTKPD